jgi:phage terminase small subunit
MASKERLERTHDAIGAPDTIDVLCAAIVAGGTLAAWCSERDVIYGAIAAWVETDETRRKRYRDALDVRDRHHKDIIIEQLRNMITSDVTQAFGVNGAMLPLEQIPPGLRQWIAGMEVEELFEGRGENRERIGYLRKIKFHDKTRSIELLMRNLAMLIDHKQISGKLTLADLLEEPAKT